MYYILIRVSGLGLKSQYKYLTTIEQGGAEVKMNFATKGLAQTYLQAMVDSGDYAIADLVVVKGCTVTATLTVNDEGY